MTFVPGDEIVLGEVGAVDPEALSGSTRERVVSGTEGLSQLPAEGEVTDSLVMWFFWENPQW